MRNRKMLLAGLITVVMGISLVGFVGCGSDNNSKRGLPQQSRRLKIRQKLRQRIQRTLMMIHLQMIPRKTQPRPQQNLQFR